MPTTSSGSARSIVTLHEPSNLAQQESSNQNFLGSCIGVIFVPAPTMRTIVRRRPIGWALIVIVVIAVAQGIAGAASSEPPEIDSLAFILGPAFTISGVAFFAAIFWLMGLFLGGRGSFRGLFAGLGFAYVPAVFNIPAIFVFSHSQFIGLPLTWVVGFGSFFWFLVLSVFAVQKNNNFSIGRAVTTVFIPMAVLLNLFIAFIVIIVWLLTNANPHDAGLS